MRTAEHALADLLDLERLQRMCDSFAAAGDIGLAVLDPGGAVLVSAGWQDICKDFHRVHADTLKACRESDARLDQRLSDGLHAPEAPRHVAHRCANGLWDVAFPLVIAGEHLGNLFTGQFFYDDDQVDVAAFRERAQRLGFDEAAYLEALARVPVLSRERVAQTIGFLADFVGMLADLGLAALRQEQKREALQESEELYRSILNASPDDVTITDLEGRVRIASPAALTMFGYEREEELLGRALTEFLVPEDRERAQADLALMLQGAHPGPGDYRGIRTDGSTLAIEVSGELIRDPNEQPTGMIFIVRDVTARKRAEEEIARTLSLLESTMESTADGLLVVDGKGGIILSNAKFREMWGVPEAIIAANDDDAALGFVLDRLKEPEVFLKTVRDLYGAPEETSFDVLELTDGRVFERYSQPQRIGASVVGRVWSFRDVTQRKRAEEALRESEEIFSSFLEHSPFYIFFKDENMRTLRLSPNWEALLGRPMDELLYKTMDELFSADLARKMDADDTQLLKDGKEITVEDERNGRFYSTVKFPIQLKGRPRYLAGYRIDITERRRAEDALRESQEQLREAHRLAHIGVWSWAPGTDAVTWTEELYRIAGLDAKLPAPTYAEHPDIYAPESWGRLQTAVEKALETGEPYRLELELIRPDGATRWVNAFGGASHDDQGRVEGLYGTVQDITERKRAEEALAHLNAELVDETAALAEANATITRIAATDHLTGLANRRSFYETLEKAVSLARRHGSPLAVVSLDLDGLKRVNDSAGHRAGDEVLTSFAALLPALRRVEDLPGRLGGDEFSVLLPGVDLGGARGLAERVLAAVRSSAALAERGVTVSGGAAQWTPGELPDDLLRRADEALYAAKRGGGDAVAGGGG